MGSCCKLWAPLPLISKPPVPRAPQRAWPSFQANFHPPLLAVTKDTLEYGIGLADFRCACLPAWSQSRAGAELGQSQSPTESHAGSRPSPADRQVGTITPAALTSHAQPQGSQAGVQKASICCSFTRLLKCVFNIS